MKSENLTDEQLFRGLARNTNAMAALIHQQLELDPAVNTHTLWQTRAQLSRIHYRASSSLFFGINSQLALTRHQFLQINFDVEKHWHGL